MIALSLNPRSSLPLILLLSSVLSALSIQAVAANVQLAQVLATTGPQTIETTSHTTDSNGNPVLRVCEVTFSPTSDGTDVVMVETCVDTPDSTSNTTTTMFTGGGGGEAVSTAATSTTASTSLATSAPVITSSGVVSITSTSAPATATIGGAANLGTSSIPNTISSKPTQTSSGTTQSATTTTTTTRDFSTTSTESATASIVAAAAVNTSLPGKSLQVLPIGLGIFAGLSVLAMIVVGLVTYERTKYRKAFRARKLAEAGSGMGYGGMADAAPNRV